MACPFFKGKPYVRPCNPLSFREEQITMSGICSYRADLAHFDFDGHTSFSFLAALIFHTEKAGETTALRCGIAIASSKLTAGSRRKSWLQPELKHLITANFLSLA